ncbi:MAG: nucleotidyltransferase family protein [Solirubrobacterales bacterium]
MQQYDAVILAGGVNSGSLRKYAPYESEALIFIGAYPMICYAFRAVRNCPRIRNIIIAGPVEALKELLKKEENVFFVPAGDDAIDSFNNAVNCPGVGPLSEQVLILPTDVPFLNVEAIEDFIDQCEAQPADFHYPLVTRAVNEKRFPGVKRTYFHLKEGVFTGGNLFMVRTAVADQCVKMAKKLVAKRKSPLAMARMFGFGLLLKFITRSLSIADAEELFKETLGIRGKAIISAFAEIGVDVDKPSDLKLAETELAHVQL